MPKKDTTAAVIGMLSTAGTRTRRESEVASATEPAAPPAATATPAVTVTEAGPAPITALRTPPVGNSPDEATAPPRTLRLRPATAQRLRQAWMLAKRDDVFLTAQDFASNLLEEALTRHQRRPAART